MRIVTFGTFDIFHVGHLRMLERARALGDTLIVGISTDELNRQKKGRDPIYPYAERAAIVAALSVVDAVFPEESLEQKAEYLRTWKADMLVIGDDWQGRFDALESICPVRYLPRTPVVSTTATIERIRQ